MTCTMLNNVSIRLMSGGHAFSNSDIETLKGAGKCAVVEIVTHKTMLRPEQGFIKADAKHDLETAGYAIAEDEVVVSTPAVEGKVAIMAVNAKCVDAITALGIEVAYTSPLLTCGDISEGSHLAIYDNVLYVLVYKEGLRFAEALAVESDADILFYLESINRVYGIYNMYARAIGDTKRLKRVCRKYFKNRF